MNAVLNVKTLLKAFLPASIRIALNTIVRHRKAVAIDKEFKRFPRELRGELIRETKLIDNRFTLLDVMPKNAVVAELGTLKGDFAEAILQQTSPKELHLFDWFLDRRNLEHVKNRFANHIEGGEVHLHVGTSCDELAKFPDNYFDWIYIDTQHHYESIKRDLAAAVRVVKNGGFVSGHDYTRWGDRGLHRYGVVEAFNEMMNATNSPLVYITNESSRHQSVVFRLVKP